MTTTPQFTATRSEYALIRAIVRRAIAMCEKLDLPIPNKVELEMDLEATHCGGCELDLMRLLEARDGDFSHDIGGIRRHMDRTTGQLGGCFQPRFKLRSA
jgi:hypothetical protein